MEFKDYREAKAKIAEIKKSLRTAKANLINLKKVRPSEEEKADHEAKVKRQQSTVKQFETKLKNAHEEAEKVRPGFFRRTGTWLVFGIVTLTAAGVGAYYYTKQQESDEVDETSSDGNGDSI